MKKNNKTEPIENHSTAAWAGIETKKPVSNVTIPSNFDTEYAKKWVDENEK
ncbi:MAG: CDIF630_02480 family spore surface protein [Solirubrobacterales bacterium]